ncbi:MAG: tRNA pseudouridine(38-40) synthase TruA [Pseudoramibacter sp.]|jgi:tRNA pseudouridine38-40 synthase|uniref:tRNA pseudouridine(38-40) synthase TruA n=1 Tax=Pseudoramibacter sp. TaxID=2034862 RepID=UPI0025DE4D4B|nr:tRNA pseudouridine(38-40) synthase TruA [Pseudoramibacter sp.]MCH4106206.1 tRNA pseudouridine(38-40) synthase TruA [Pseudoramibacter sp.]
MKNIALVIAYRGGAFAGWQIQKNAQTVEGNLKKAIREVTGEDVVVYGAGRTDAGVHARGQRANFKTASAIPADRFAFALNAHLPEAVRVMQSFEVPMAFHSRYDAKGKCYTYRVYRGRIADPLMADYSWQYGYALDVDKIRKAARAVIGTHDFKSFQAAGSSAKTSVRRVDRIEVKESGPMLILHYYGNGFLYNMVRILTGTLLAIGSGKLPEDSMPAIIAAKSRKAAGVTAPAKGLELTRVYY